MVDPLVSATRVFVIGFLVLAGTTLAMLQASAAATPEKIGKMKEAYTEFLPPQPVKGEAHLYWPEERPSWCEQNVHFCIRASDSLDRNLSPYAISLKFLRPVRQKNLKGDNKQKKLGESCKSRTFGDGVRGKMVEILHYKSQKMRLFCQPLPIDNAPAFHFQLEPGKSHPIFLDTYAAYPTVFSAPASALTGLKKPTIRKEGDIDNRPIVDCLGATVKNHTTTQGKACVGGRASTGLTVKGIVVVHGRRDAAGNIRVRPGGDAYYRCIFGEQNTLLEDVDLLGCKHGIQGGGGKGWTFRRLKMLDCSIKGSGYAHCIYTAPPKGVTSVVHELLLVEDSYLQTCGGHVIKSNSNKTIVRNSRLVEGAGNKCDAGNAIHNNAAMSVVLENVVIEQPESKGNTHIFSVGSGNVKRCRGKQNGEWTLKNVTIKDTDPRSYRRYKENCPNMAPGIWADLGGNTINGAPLFDSRGVPFKRK